MAIRRMVGEDHAGRPGIEKEDWDGRPIYLETTHVGMVLSLHERNGYHDSDFYATVWTSEGPQTIEYATTRGWTYPNRAWVDATPEVLKAYAAWSAARDAELRARFEAEQAKVPRVGDLVRTTGGRKVPKGTEAEVTWVGKGFARKSHYAPRFAELIIGPTYNPADYRVGLRLLDGTRVFVSASHTELARREGVQSTPKSA